MSFWGLEQKIRLPMGTGSVSSRESLPRTVTCLYLKIVKKLLSIRLWNKDDGKSGLSETPSMRWSDNIEQADGEILIISQFTLFSQLKGTKVDFHRAMKAADAQVVYDSIVQRLREAMPEGRVQTGTFGAMMQVDIVNDGRKRFPQFAPLECQD